MNSLLMKLLNKLNAPVDGDGADGSGAPEKEVDTAVGSGEGEFDSSWLLGDEEEAAAEVEVKTEVEADKGEEVEVKEEEEGVLVPDVEVKKEEEVKPEVEEPQKEVTDEEREEQHKAYLADVEKMFAISEDDANLLLTEPEKVLPKLSAQLHDFTMRKVVEMQQMMLQQLPQYIEQLSAVKQEASGQEAMFMQANEHLATMDKTELRELINQYGPLLVKQMAGKTPQEKLVALGDVISTVKGIPRVAPVIKKEEPAKPKARPYTPVAPAQSGALSGRPAPATPEESFIDMLLNSEE